MATFGKRLLSGSTEGLPIKLTNAVIASGVELHTAVAGVVNKDEIYLFVSNLTAAPVTLTIAKGGTTDPDHLIAKNVPIPAYAVQIPVCLGTPLQNSKVVRARAGSNDALVIDGWVNRITES